MIYKQKHNPKRKERNFLHAVSTRAVMAALLFVSAVQAFASSSSVEKQGEVSIPFSRYRPILDKQAFGPPPPSAEELEAARQAEEQAALEAAQEGMIEIIPTGLDKIKVTMLTSFGGFPAVGFLDGTDGRSYLLHEGEEFEEIACEKINLEAQTVVLVRGGQSAELPLWINPVTTNSADVTSFGQPGGKPVELPTGTDWEMEAAREKAQQEVEDRRARLLRQKEEREAREKEFREKMAAMTPEERNNEMHRINREIIRSGGPPLPLTLDENDVRELEGEFEIPDEVREEAKRESERAARRYRRGPGRGGPRGRMPPRLQQPENTEEEED